MGSQPDFKLALPHIGFHQDQFGVGGHMPSRDQAGRYALRVAHLFGPEVSKLRFRACIGSDLLDAGGEPSGCRSIRLYRLGDRTLCFAGKLDIQERFQIVSRAAN